LQDENRLIKTATRNEGNGLVLVVEGAAESDSMDKLAAAIEDADQQAKSSQAQRIVADIRTLEFCTSSCLKVFATWVVEQPTPAPYKIVFLSNPAHSWQRRSLKALTMCAPEIASVEESGST
jgi:hypothetical protein